MFAGFAGFVFVHLAQLDRASGYGPEGRGFESSNARHLRLLPHQKEPVFILKEKIMTKEEFLAELRACLSGKMSPQEIESNIDYYRAYIEGEIMKGRSEADVMEELGSARLIAKTLTANLKDDEELRRGHYESSDYSSGSSGGSSYNNGEYNEGAGGGAQSGQKGTGKRILRGIIIAVAVMLVLFLFGGLFRGIFRLIIRFLPFIIFIALIVWITRSAGSGRR